MKNFKVSYLVDGGPVQSRKIYAQTHVEAASFILNTTNSVVEIVCIEELPDDTRIYQQVIDASTHVVVDTDESKKEENILLNNRPHYKTFMDFFLNETTPLEIGDIIPAPSCCGFAPINFEVVGKCNNNRLILQTVNVLCRTHGEVATFPFDDAKYNTESLPCTNWDICEIRKWLNNAFIRYFYLNDNGTEKTGDAMIEAVQFVNFLHLYGNKCKRWNHGSKLDEEIICYDKVWLPSIEDLGIVFTDESEVLTKYRKRIIEKDTFPTRIKTDMSGRPVRYMTRSSPVNHPEKIGCIDEKGLLLLSDRLVIEPNAIAPLICI